MSDLFQKVCKATGLPVPVSEYRFAPPRKFRFDYCWPEYRVALECDGGVWTQGRHTRGSGFLKDMEKFNLAAVHGYYVLRTTPGQLQSAETLDLIRRALKANPPLTAGLPEGT